MKIIWDTDFSVMAVSFGATISCNGKTCQEYTGAIPSGYKSLEEWFEKNATQLYRWKVRSTLSQINFRPTTIELDSSVPVRSTASRQELNVTARDTSKTTVNNFTAFYHPALCMAFCRVELSLVTALAADMTRAVANVEGRRPVYIHPLAVTSTGQASGYINAEGTLSIYAHEALPAGTTVRLAGWWIVATNQRE